MYSDINITISVLLIVIFCIQYNFVLAEITYTRLMNTDTTKVSGFLMQCYMTEANRCGKMPCIDWSVNHTSGPPCNVTSLEMGCRNVPGCAGFNTDGWLKGCVNASCGSSRHSFNGVDTYVGSAVTPYPPVPPVPIVDDWHYPIEEIDESSQLMSMFPILKALTVTDNTTGSVTFQDPTSGKIEHGSVGTTFFGVWFVQSFLLRSHALPFVVLEHNFARWGVIAYVQLNASAVILRHGVGLVSKIQRPRYNLTQPYSKYWNRATNDPEDWLAVRIRNLTAGEADFKHSASFLTPPRDYTMVGVPNAHTKFSVSLDGRINVANLSIFVPTLEGDVTIGKEKTVQVFDPRNYTSFWPTTNFTDYKSALIGRYTRAVIIGAFDQPSRKGFSMAVTPNPKRGLTNDDMAQVLIRLGDVDASTSIPKFRYFSVTSDRESVSEQADGALFYAALLDHTAEWDIFFKQEDAMQVKLLYDPSEGQRLVDMARAAISSSMSVWIGLHPNYGDGVNYWSIAQKDSGSLPLQSFALDHALLHWGYASEAAKRISFYLQNYVRDENGIDPGDKVPGNSSGPPGSIDLKHWKDSCWFADGLSVYGRWIDLFVDTARAMESIDGGKWASQNYPRAKLMVNYILSLRLTAVAKKYPPPFTGMIYGPAEHDTCSDERHYFSVNMWAWRGFIQMIRWLKETKAVSDPLLITNLTTEAIAYKKDLDRALEASIVRNSTGHPIFIPPFAAINFTPFNSMVQSTISSYSNFRYWSEMLSSDYLNSSTAFVLAEFRETHTGTLSGMTRFRDHLDDMPSVGYAYSGLSLDRVESFQSLLFGHIANYQSRGTFNSPEQLSLYGDANSDSMREYLHAGTNEIDIDFCVPSTMLVTFMLKYALVLEERDVDAVWIMKGAPRRWYSSNTTLVASVKSALTRYGSVSFTIEANDSNSFITNISLALSGRGYISGSKSLTLKLRIRDPNNVKRVHNAQVTGDGKLLEVDPISESVNLQVTDNSEGKKLITIVAHLQ